jgi:hypothetical protein
VTRSRHLALAAALAAGLLLVVALGRAATVAGQRGVPGGAPVHGNSSLEAARGLPGGAPYFAGASVAGLPLTAVERRSDSARYVSVLYGDCLAVDHQGCALPLEIQTWPACVRSLADYDESDPLAPRPERMRVRGVPAAVLDEGRQLELQTGSSTVVIFGESRALVNRAAAALRRADGGDRAGDPLRPPVPGAMEGTLACPE